VDNNSAVNANDNRKPRKGKHATKALSAIFVQLGIQFSIVLIVVAIWLLVITRIKIDSDTAVAVTVVTSVIMVSAQITAGIKYYRYLYGRAAAQGMWFRSETGEKTPNQAAGQNTAHEPPIKAYTPEPPENAPDKKVEESLRSITKEKPTRRAQHVAHHKSCIAENVTYYESKQAVYERLQTVLVIVALAIMLLLVLFFIGCIFSIIKNTALNNIGAVMRFLSSLGGAVGSPIIGGFAGKQLWRFADDFKEHIQYYAEKRAKYKDQLLWWGSIEGKTGKEQQNHIDACITASLLAVYSVPEAERGAARENPKRGAKGDS
jgi:hypothetical protein